MAKSNEETLTVKFEGKLAWCIRRACRNEGVGKDEWMRSLVENYLLVGSGYRSIDELYDDNTE